MSSVLRGKPEFLATLHAEYLTQFLDGDTETLDYFLTVHLRNGGAYWGLTALDLIGKLGELGKN